MQTACENVNVAFLSMHGTRTVTCGSFIGNNCDCIVTMPVAKAHVVVK
jgi:hypothetical protein